MLPEQFNLEQLTRRFGWSFDELKESEKEEILALAQEIRGYRCGAEDAGIKTKSFYLSVVEHLRGHLCHIPVTEKRKRLEDRLGWRKTKGRYITSWIKTASATATGSGVAAVIAKYSVLPEWISSMFYASALMAVLSVPIYLAGSQIKYRRSNEFRELCEKREKLMAPYQRFVSYQFGLECKIRNSLEHLNVEAKNYPKNGSIDLPLEIAFLYQRVGVSLDVDAFDEILDKAISKALLVDADISTDGLAKRYLSKNDLTKFFFLILFKCLACLLLN